MKEIYVLIIISAMLLPFNLFCTFWIFREIMNLSGVTFRETIENIGGRLGTIPTGRFHSGSKRRKKIVYEFLLERSYNPERTKVLFKWYIYSTIPGLLSFILVEYIAVFLGQNTKSVAVSGICTLFVIDLFLLLYRQIYRKNNPLDEKIESELKKKKNTLAKVRDIIVYTVVGAIFLSIYIFLNLGIAQVTRESVNNSGTPSSNTTVMLDHNKVKPIVENQGFETYGIGTTYWYIKEENLSFVVAGKKDEVKFEFYEYGDFNTAEIAYREIWSDLSENLSSEVYSGFEKDLNYGGKIITYETGGIKTYLLYKDGNVIYAYASADNCEIEALLKKLGCTVK